ncbi:MAG: Do family serine endopeptidase [bacterium]|jgi:serine protease Do
MKKNIFIGLLIASLGGFVGVAAYKFFEDKGPTTITEKQKVQFASLPTYAEPDGGTDFTVAAAKTVAAVVHIKVTMSSSPQANYIDPIFRDFFGDGGFPFGQRGPSMGSGSGVIISADGYIVTNNHVVNGADKIEVVLNDKRSYKGKVIGTDPNTDLALVKIEADNLPFVVYGNSDNVKIGEWVLAVGNPLNLTSTVTAGIVSAKGRNINIIGEDGSRTPFPIESFIQTDAAVNRGNSGGALVNTRGELVGINTAIASQTGMYAGYSFAVPVNLVKKVMDDLLEYGKVQRAFLGVQIQEVNSDVAKEKGLKSTRGVLVARVNDGGAAELAGVQSGDVIISVAGVEVNSTSELMEQVGRHRPGDKIDIKVIRENKDKNLAVVLRGEDNTTDFKKKEPINVNNLLGAEFQDLSSSEKKNLRIENGVKINSLKAGKMSSVGIRSGFIITRLNNKTVSSAEDVDNIVNSSENNMIMIEGVYPQNPNSKYVYSFNIK